MNEQNENSSYNTSIKKYPCNKYEQDNEQNINPNRQLNKSINYTNHTINTNFNNSTNQNYFNSNNYSHSFNSGNNKIINSFNNKYSKNKNKSILSSKVSKKHNLNKSQVKIKKNQFKFIKEQNKELQDQLSKYKQLAVQLRKRNEELKNKMIKLQQSNKKDIKQLWNQINKISIKQNKGHSAKKILDNLQLIQKSIPKEGTEYKQFYQNFINSVRESWKVTDNQNGVSSAIRLWKHMLNFLILNNYQPLTL